jgi:hypothetical protein
MRYFDLTDPRELKKMYLQREGTRILKADTRRRRPRLEGANLTQKRPPIRLALPSMPPRGFFPIVSPKRQAVMGDFSVLHAGAWKRNHFSSRSTRRIASGAASIDSAASTSSRIQRTSLSATLNSSDLNRSSSIGSGAGCGSASSRSRWPHSSRKKSTRWSLRLK